MKLKEIAKIQSGYIARGRIIPREDGACFLLQARDVAGDQFSYSTDAMIRFSPTISGKDWFLECGDILFMARGARNFSVLITELPENVLAAACFFIIRASDTEILPSYLSWNLNQSPVEQYLRRFSGRGVNMPVVRRSVLESVDIPIPPVGTQRQVSEISDLLRKEQHLYRELAEKRKGLITQICLKAISKHDGQR